MRAPPRLIASLVLVVVVLAGCVTDGNGDESTVEPPSGSTTPVSTADLIDAIGRLAEMPHRAEGFLDFPDAAELDPELPLLRIDFDGTWSAATTLLPPNQAEGAPTAIVITDRTTAYYFLPGFPDAIGPASMLTESPLVDAVEGWISVDLSQLEVLRGRLLPIEVSETTFELVADLVDDIGASVFDEGPPASSRGVETRTFTTVIDDPGPFEELDSQREVTIHLDERNRVRQVTSRDEFFGTSRVEFFDFDTDIVVELPAGAVDKTEEFARLIAPGSIAEAGPPEPTPLPTTPPLPTPLSLPTPLPAADSVLGMIDVQPELSTFRSLITEAGLDSVLAAPNPEPWTVFVPTNDALEFLGESFEEIRNDPLRLRTFVSDHLVPGDYDRAALEVAGSVRTLQGLNIALGVRSDGCESIGGNACFLVADITAIDGTMHIVDRPLPIVVP